MAVRAGSRFRAGVAFFVRLRFEPARPPRCKAAGSRFTQRPNRSLRGWADTLRQRMIPGQEDFAYDA